MKIIFVDDDEHFLEGVKRHLSVEHNDVKFFLFTSPHNVRETLSKDTFDAIVADIRMPGEDGISLMRFAKEQYPKMVRVILTALEDEKLLKAAQEVSHHTFMKPCDIENILSAVKDTQASLC